MTKRQLVLKLAAETGWSQVDLQVVLQKILDHWIDALARGERIEFRDFGVFEVCTRKARVGRNPLRPHIPVPIPDRKTVKFKPGRIMKLKVSGSPAGTPSPPSA